MRVLIMSGPDGSLANALFKADVSELVCVTQGNVHLRTRHGVVSGSAIARPRPIEIDVPAIRAQLVKAYPLIDRWVSNRQSISMTLELLLEYTTTLIQIIGNHAPLFAVLETGAPHHLFSYCLDTALRYAGVPAYYLYGNAFDGRCLVVQGNEKNTFVRVGEYSAQKVVDRYIQDVQRNASYTPADSTNSLAPFLHKWQPYAGYLYLRQAAAKYYNRLKAPSRHSDVSDVRLRLPYVGFTELLGILNAHRQYRKLMNSDGPFQVGRIGAGDVVYVGHMVPEATSFPESPEYPGEIDILIDLKNRFPDARVFYREHPAIAIYSEFGHIHLQGLHKCPEFYRQLTRLGIEIIPPGMHISKIRDRGCLFATKTGRVAVENSVLGIPTLIYGYPFYGRDLPLTFHVGQLSPDLDVRDIKALAAKVQDPVAAIRSYLTTTFSGSIENPGIGLGSDTSLRPQFEADVVRLVRQLAVEYSEVKMIG